LGFARKRLFYGVTFTLALFFVAPLMLIEGIYLYGLSLIHVLPPPPQQEPLPVLARAAIWATFREQGPTKVKPIHSWDVLYSLIRMDGYLAPGYRIADYVALRHFPEQDTAEGKLIRHIKDFSAAVWLSRNWTSDQIILEAGRLLPVLAGVEGVNNGSLKIFGKKIDELTTSETALILALESFHGIEEEAVKRPKELLARRNRIVETMFRNGAISEADMQKAITQPIKLRNIGRDRSSRTKAK